MSVQLWQHARTTRTTNKQPTQRTAKLSYSCRLDVWYGSTIFLVSSFTRSSIFVCFTYDTLPLSCCCIQRKKWESDATNSRYALIDLFAVFCEQRMILRWRHYLFCLAMPRCWQSFTRRFDSLVNTQRPHMYIHTYVHDACMFIMQFILLSTTWAWIPVIFLPPVAVSMATEDFHRAVPSNLHTMSWWETRIPSDDLIAYLSYPWHGLLPYMVRRDER